MRIAPLFFLVSACGVVKVDIPNVGRSYAITAQSSTEGGCGIDGVLFQTQVAVTEMQQRLYGFRACVNNVDDAQISADVSTYEAGPSCNHPQGTISSLQVHVAYSAQGLAKVATVDCGQDAVDLSQEAAVEAAVNACLSRVAAQRTDLVAALNAASGVLNISLTGDCSADACFKASADLAVELSGIEASNCL